MSFFISLLLKHICTLPVILCVVGNAAIWIGSAMIWHVYTISAYTLGSDDLQSAFQYQNIAFIVAG